MNSWLLSIRCPDFAATARATDTAWARASAVSASAAGASLRHSSRSNDGSENCRQPRRQCADRRHHCHAGGSERVAEQAARDQPDDHVGDLRKPSFRGDRGDERKRARREDPRIRRRRIADERAQALEEPRTRRHRHPGEIPELRGDDEQARPRREPDDDRVRDEVDERSEAREPHRDLHEADEQREREHEADVVGASGRRHRGDRCEYGQRDRIGGT